MAPRAAPSAVSTSACSAAGTFSPFSFSVLSVPSDQRVEVVARLHRLAALLVGVRIRLGLQQYAEA